MHFAILGTGMVGQTLAGKLIALGHEVTMGARSAENANASAFTATDDKAHNGTFADAAAAGEIIIAATNGAATIAALESAGEANLAGKVVIDVTNPLDFSNGFPPSFIPGFTNTTSLGEAVQARFPLSRIVKALNTVNCDVMIDPQKLGEPGDIFICGDDDDAKAVTADLLKSFGWAAPVDLGGISAARGTEAYLALWVRLLGVMGGGDFNIKLVK